MENTLKLISLMSYSLIILTGQIIGLPFLFWLLWTSFEVGNSDQIVAVLGLIGTIIVFTKLFEIRIMKILSFGLMITPILKRLVEVPLEKFNYLGFQIPLSIFIITYLILIFMPNNKTKNLNIRLYNKS